MLVRQAITTKFLCCTNFKGSRVKAKAAAGSITLEWDHALNPEDNHKRAAEALANKYKWKGNWFMGGMPEDSGYCFVSCDELPGSLAFVTGVNAGRENEVEGDDEPSLEQQMESLRTGKL